MFIFLLPHPLAVRGVERPTNRWWTFAAHALLRRGREKRNTLPRAKNPSSHFQNQALSALSARRSPTSTTLTCTDIPQTAAPGKLCREAQPRPSAASLHQLWAQPHDAREGFCFPSPLLFCCGLGTFLSARWCPLTCGRAEFGAGVCYAGSALCDLCQDAILCKSSDFGSILPVLIPAWRLFCCKRIITK